MWVLPRAPQEGLGAFYPLGRGLDANYLVEVVIWEPPAMWCPGPTLPWVLAPWGGRQKPCSE